ncbi:MAG: DUF1858 domain-containing protein [Anaerovorax sp.]
MLVNDKMSVSEILDKDPDITEIFLSHGLNCLGCPGSYNESLREAAEGHGVCLEVLIKDLNQYLKDVE